MTKREFLQEFGTMWNNINSDMAPGMTYQEISHIASHVQEVLVRSIYNGTLGEPFESTEEARSYLDNLVRQCELPRMGTNNIPEDNSKIDSDSVSFVLTDNIGGDSHIMYIVYESVEFDSNAPKCYRNSTVIVKPVSHDMYWHIKDNPFKGAGTNRVLRLTKSTEINGNRYDVAEIITKCGDISKYKVRYVRRPNDIEFDDNNLDEPLCELHENLHRLTLNSSVAMAKELWNS